MFIPATMYLELLSPSLSSSLSVSLSLLFMKTLHSEFEPLNVMEQKKLICIRCCISHYVKLYYIHSIVYLGNNNTSTTTFCISCLYLCYRVENFKKSQPYSCCSSKLKKIRSCVWSILYQKADL